MNVIGLHAFTHDSACCLVQGGRLLAYAEEERFTRIKHDASFPGHALRYCASHLQGGLPSVDAAAIAWAPFRGLARRAATTFYNLRSPLRRASAQGWKWLQIVGVPRRLRRLGFSGRFTYVDHYRAHAASAFHTSGFPEAAIMVVDGVGEVSTTSFWKGSSGSLERLWEIAYPHSLGLAYGAVTEFLGYRINCDEGIVMGLSALGGPAYLAAMRDVVSYDGGRAFRVDTRCFDFGGTWFTPAFVRRFGPPRVLGDPPTSRDADLAFAIQRRTEEVAMGLLGRLHAATGMRRLCVSGGVALNSVLNGRILREGPFRDVFILPASHDAGAALGAALAIAPPSTPPTFTPFVGPGFGPLEARGALDEAGLHYEHLGEGLASRAAARLASGDVVGWYSGRAEMGPRALGNRSIFADPRSPRSRQRINARIKGRESFRPLAPAILADRAGRYFEIDRPLRHMLVVVRATEEGRRSLPAVVHVDGTARIQTVTREDNPALAELLEAFEKETGVAALLNTSFNRSGEPMVLTPQDAVRTFQATDLDALAIEGLWVERGRS